MSTTDLSTDYWARTEPQLGSGADDYWLAVPPFAERFQFDATGGHLPWHVHWTEALLTQRGSLLSLGCGPGSLERDLIDLGLIGEAVGVDLSANLIERAKEAKDGRAIEYYCDDLNSWVPPANEFDLAFFNMSLHHVDALDQCLNNVSAALKPGGYMICSEYTGPDRFAFSAERRFVMETIYRLIPSYARRRTVPPYDTLNALWLPDPDEVALIDPSEAVHSSKIVEATERHFELIANRALCGSFLQFGVTGFAGRFRDPLLAQLAADIIFIERALMESGHLEVDFRLLVARKPF